MSIKEHGINKFGRLIDQNIEQAQYLTGLINDNKHLKLMSATVINIVCFRYELDTLLEESKLKAINTEIMLQLQLGGIASISDTTIHGKHCLRVAITNYRTIKSDLDLFISELLRIAKEII